MRLAVRFSKGDAVRFVSHLDVMRLFQRAFRRAKLPLAYSQGFNPHPLISFATALSVGMTSRCEYLDAVLDEDVAPDVFRAAVREHLPEGVDVVEVFDLKDSRKSLTSAMRSASYSAKAVFAAPVNRERLEAAVSELLSGEIVVQKKTKGGIKPTDIRPMVKEMTLEAVDGTDAVFFIRGALTAEGGLNPDMLLKELWAKLGEEASSDIERIEIELDRQYLLS